jgi:FkbM family methyltransferase
MKPLRALAHALGLRAQRRDAEAFAAQRRLVRADAPVIFDVGAHLGQTALRYRALFPRATIHCFEPFPESFAALSRALAPDAGVHAHRLALGSAAGHGTLNVNRSSATNSLLRSDERAAGYWGRDLLDTQTTIEVPLATLDAFCAERSIAHVDLLKLDVQGAELAVLEGAAALLRTQAIDVVYMEMIVAPTYVGQHDLHDYLGLFRAHGYVLFDFYNPVRTHGRLLQTDNLFVAEPFLAAYERDCRSAEPRRDS